MRINKIKTNVTVLNKVDRKNYQIINIDGSGDSIKGTAKLIKEDGSLDASVTAVITANNAIAYKLIDDPNIPDVPTGYTVENGILLKNGVPATEQGSLVINNVIAGVAGRLILILCHIQLSQISLISLSEDLFQRLQLLLLLRIRCSYI